MDRRGFLKLFGGAAAAAVVAPKVSYFFAPVGGWQSDLIFSPSDALYALNRSSMKHVHYPRTEEWVVGKNDYLYPAPPIDPHLFDYARLIQEYAHLVSGVPPQYHGINRH